LNIKPVILNLSLLVLACVNALSQPKPVFSSDQSKFRDELTAFMGTSLSEENTKVLAGFFSKWDSTGFSEINKSRIHDVSAKLAEKQFRPVPQFIDFLKTASDIINYKNDNALLGNWLEGLNDLILISRYSNANLATYIQNTGLLIRENLLINTSSVKWKVKSGDLKFARDTAFRADLSNATLTCYSQKDSTEIYNVSGSYYPSARLFRGKKGTVTWEKVGFPGKDVFAELSDYQINVTRNNFTCDSARLTYTGYFNKPEYGLLTDQAAPVSNRDKAAYPRFETYTKKFRIKRIFDGIDYEGGLAFEGARAKGTGEKAFPARLMLYRKDTLFIKVASTDFIFSANGLNSQETAATIYLGADSVYHSNLGFSYNANTKQVNLFRTNNPVSKSPYFNTYHEIDMYFENLTWEMNSSRVIISRPRGAAMGQALFESASFFNSDDFLNLMALDSYHPLSRLIKFSEYFYSETFPVSEFAKWLNKPEDVVTGLCIDLANRGFIFYDQTNNEVTIKQKTKDYINSYAGKKDYDIIAVYSETKAPVDNAVLDLKSYDLTVNGVKNVFISDSQRVAIYPYNRQLVIKKNRDIKFDGVVQAGLFTVFGRNFQFSYDTFKIRLQNIDSIRIAVETGKTDQAGNPVIDDVSSIIQLAKGEIYIDNPNNKAGLRNYAQYPIINASTYSYIFYDRIPGLENVYKKDNFYFRIDPFVFEHIDHYTKENMNLKGEFFAGNILKPTRQFLIIQENNSLGFQMIVPKEGIDLYEGKARIFDQLSMSNRGLTGSGTLKHLTSTTIAEDYRFFPDSMLTRAKTFNIARDEAGIFPEVASNDVDIKWLPGKDEWTARNSKDSNFGMFANGTSLNGSMTLKPKQLSGSGIINTSDSRVVSNLYTFRSGTIHADTADYNLKSPSTEGYAFIAENANTDMNFDTRLTRFRLNTDSSMVKFPEVQYICTMTDFEYNQANRILSMEQKGKKSGTLMKSDNLLRVPLNGTDRPTFFATNSLKDTIAFASLSAKYHVDEEYIEAENINYIKVADALIQPENGKVKISRRAEMEKLKNAVVAVNNLHLIHSAAIEIESSRRYTGSGVYDYTDESNNVYQIKLSEIAVDTLTTNAKGFIAADDKFMLSPAFTFTGDVSLSARSKDLLFTGSAGILHDCSRIKSYPVKFKSFIDPGNVMIPISEKPRDINDEMVFSGSFINLDSLHIYPAFLSAQKSWSDVGLVSAGGVLWYNKKLNKYQISSKEKIADPALNGDMVALDKNLCNLSGEGKINFGANFDLVKMGSAGSFIQEGDSGKVEIKAILALDFYFSPEALRLMSDEFRMMPTLKAVNVNSEFYNKGMKDLLGTTAAGQLKEETDLFGASRNLPREFTYKLLLNEVTLYWNEESSSFRSKGRIGIGFIGNQPLNIYVDGYVDIQRRRSGDMIDIYLKANQSTWYYFSYFKGVMMAQAGNLEFNNLISSIKLKDRQHPESSTRVPYTYMIAVEDRLGKFLRRMQGGGAEEQQQDVTPLDNIFQRP